jgi:pimeloyl-ACP methyl ester carboxylesterase
MPMIDDPRGRIDYDEAGTGLALVFLPGSCSTGAAWRPIIAALGDGYRCVTTSLLGYGGTAERRTPADCAIAHEIDVVEAVIARAACPVHLVGHSFGGLVALAVALRGRAPLASLVIVEAPAAELLRAAGESAHYATFRAMTQAYFADFQSGNGAAIARMIDFYGGAGTYASWPEKVRAYAMETTAVNILDWASAYGFPLSPAALAAIRVPSLVLWGAASHPAAQRANELLGACLQGASLATIPGAAHFMIATHAGTVAAHIAAHVRRAAAS